MSDIVYVPLQITIENYNEVEESINRMLKEEGDSKVLFLPTGYVNCDRVTILCTKKVFEMHTYLKVGRKSIETGCVYAELDTYSVEIDGNEISFVNI